MNIHDFLLCTFDGDSANPPTDYVAEITAIDAASTSFHCRLVDTGQQFTFDYGTDPWVGKDTSGTKYTLNKHEIYSGGSMSPFPQGAALVTFRDNKTYLCYVERMDSTIDVVFYHYPCPKLSIENDIIVKSNWGAYSVGSPVISIEGCVLDTDLPIGGAMVTEDAKPPFLFVDLYRHNLKGKPVWENLVKVPQFYGAIIKATEGISYNTEWFVKNWPAVKDAGKERYGKTWFRGAYHFLRFNRDGVEQADYYLATIDAAGGWDDGDIYPVIDVELGNDGSKNPEKRSSNHDASSQQIIDCTTACAERLRSITGRKVMMYGRGAMRDKRINDKMGCDLVWNPSYTKTMVRNGLDAWELDDIALWQYCGGKGTAAVDDDKLPATVANFGDTDISVYIEGANKPTLKKLKERLGIGS